ncbi:MAG: hypothetical protein PV344_04470, partial [Anaplasma sp.]|nr:hypothetical protein [Anaplasma sp.]
FRFVTFPTTSSGFPAKSGRFSVVTSFCYCKRLNFRKDIIFANFANCLRFTKNRSHEQFGHYVNTTEATFDL